ncbi:RIP metalloprotease RseP [Desertifilum sp. FACHB-1129]|uniref:Zinc metalloprotease n=1 Tax=Desertifilum tharense IPPAS B-1220 TaxID=1781255 RepID=A0A1E5QKX1_9CYAN|nr:MULTISPECIES: RIP metalloprotease RseP [Desertifilum]MDA0211749.1 RIP metalloprotease RseP [Cyanobacteria bacterium FC1]MDI9639022.1 RIP metalloprotease RseP [Geitlerinema splendidum]MBD2311979.1 RIP metalloprotease RseP [Desertifilum sp. FACHB-1129]MBD2322431.1 RIP metalloprotease RseP [Desertifilum sp. FACHB-866]MBD2332594.1 RIP metalloprotease RseP [Desertifilum sp. FACHB-868]
MSVLAAIAVLAVLILVHELGHFLAARLQGIYANRFSLGFGPILWKYQGSETEYAIRAFPLGGFVGFPDDDPDSPIPPDDPNLLRNRPILDRAIVISAGVIANLVFAYIVLVALIGLQGVPENINYQPGVLIPEVLAETSPAAQAGIQAGDVVLAIEGQTLDANPDSIPLLQERIQSNPNQPLELTLERNSQRLSVQVIPEAGADGKGRIGVQLFPNGTPIYRRPSNPFEVLGLAADRFQNIVVRTAQGFAQLVTNFQSVAGQVGGPVRIVEEGAKFAQNDSANLLLFAAIISVNLAILNILPLPALDGGQLAFLLIEGLRGKPLPSKIQDGVMQTGLMLLLGLGVFLIVRDTAQLEFFQQFFQ